MAFVLLYCTMGDHMQNIVPGVGDVGAEQFPIGLILGLNRPIP